VKFALIEAEKATCPVETACKALGVSRPGFYAWRSRPESAHSRVDRRLAVLVRESHERSRNTYGSPRIHADLRAQGICTSRKRVIRVMQDQELRARVRRRYKCTTMSDHDQPVAPNLLDRRFEAEAPNQRWVRHHRTAHRRERQTFPCRGGGLVLAVHSRVGLVVARHLG